MLGPLRAAPPFRAAVGCHWLPLAVIGCHSRGICVESHSNPAAIARATRHNTGQRSPAGGQVPLMVEEGYRASGWLGLLLGARLGMNPIVAFEKHFRKKTR